MEKKYTITLNEQQLRLLETMTDVTSRLICGQLDYSLKDYALQAWERDHKTKEHPNGCGGTEWSNMRKELDTYIDKIRQLCWGQDKYSYNGINYDDTADELYDMHCVLRKFRYDNIFTDEERKKAEMTVLSNPPLHVSEEPLIEVNENPEK